ncbi:AAA family ATPase [Rhodobacterales bacterium HKCCE3408]|nr:AAA family ATPase [Rhodobacterales bacterium HKCCE3408]
MKRVMIIGQPGSGKSTLARKLGKVTGLPVVHLDQIHWKPGWEPRSPAEKLPLVRAAEAGESWIIEGNLASTWQSRLSRADTVVILDLPVALRAWRIFRRTLIGYGNSRPDLPDNCPERFEPEFWHYVWTTRNTYRQRLHGFARQACDRADTYLLRSPSEVRAFLRSVSPDRTAAPLPLAHPLT